MALVGDVHAMLGVAVGVVSGVCAMLGVAVGVVSDVYAFWGMAVGEVIWAFGGVECNVVVI